MSPWESSHWITWLLFLPTSGRILLFILSKEKEKSMAFQHIQDIDRYKGFNRKKKCTGCNTKKSFLRPSIKDMGGRWVKNVLCNTIYAIFFQRSHTILAHLPLLKIVLIGYRSAFPSLQVSLFKEAGFLCVIWGDRTVRLTGSQIVIDLH